MTTPTRMTQDTGIDLDLSATSSDADTRKSVSDAPGSSAPLSALTNARISFDRERSGKQHGHLTLAISTPEHCAYQLQIPVCQIKGTKPGPAITLLAGIHGDEPEGTLAVHRLARELSEADISGCLTLLPAINATGVERGQRSHQPDGQSLDYAFPGNVAGTPSEQLADAINVHFIKQSDLVLDLRSGGQRLQFVVSAAVRFTTDKSARERVEAAMIAFGAPNSLRLPASAPDSCLQGTLSAMGKDYLQVELGGGGTYSRHILDKAHSGCLNVLRHRGMLSDELELAATRLLEVRDESYYLYADASGLFEPLVFAGGPVWHDEPMANIINVYDTQAAVRPVMPPRSAILVASHPGGFVRQGELLAVLAEEVHG